MTSTTLGLGLTDRIAARLGHVPRETRDTLFLLVVIACCIGPLVAHLPLWTSTLTAALLAWRGWLVWQQHPLPGRWVLGTLLALAVGLTLLTHRTLVGTQAGVTLIVMLLALKTLELRARRDAIVVFFLGFFTLLATFLFSQSLPTAAATLLALLGLLTALVNAHLPSGRPPLLQSMRTAATMTLLGAPIMLALFLFFPRIAPLWGIPNDTLSGRSGLSNQMSVGSMASMALDNRIAMRVRFDNGRLPPSNAMYFRGPVLTAFNGRDWYALNQPEARSITWAMPAPPLLQVHGDAFRYEVTLEGHRRHWLLTLDAAAERPELPPGTWAFMAPELQWLSNRPVVSVLRYRAQSHLQFSHGPLRRSSALRAYVQLPKGMNPRTLELAQQMRADPALAAGDTAAYVQAALTRLRTGGYSYSLDPGVYGEHTADEFWFDRKEGFCEHIASAFVVLMRALDIPARIVTGYQGGEMNHIDDYWVVRQSDAHAWAEVWSEGQGWLRVDPTGAIAPNRIGQFERLQTTPGLLGSAVDTLISPGFAQYLRALWEALDNGWNQQVLNYTQERQFNLLRALGLKAVDWQTLLQLLCMALGLYLSGWLLFTYWEKGRDPWQHLLIRATKTLDHSGLHLPNYSTPRSMAQRIRQHFGESGEAAAQWMLRYESARYGKHRTATPRQLWRQWLRAQKSL